MAVFHAGPSHSYSRRGFRCTFQAVDGLTLPPTAPSTPSVPEECLMQIVPTNPEEGNVCYITLYYQVKVTTSNKGI